MSSLKQRVDRLEALKDMGTPGRVVLVRSNGAPQEFIEACVASSEIGFRPGVDQIAHLSLADPEHAAPLAEVISALPLSLRRG